MTQTQHGGVQSAEDLHSAKNAKVVWGPFLKLMVGSAWPVQGLVLATERDKVPFLVGLGNGPEGQSSF